jgi:hypothetical protein
MNTFLAFPYPFEASASVLDDARLRKQQVECGQILDVLRGKTEAWRSHPCVIQWAKFEAALTYYGKAIAEECQSRGFQSSFLKTHFKLFKHRPMPPWMGHGPFHASHRSKLLFKGRVDAICYALREYLGVRSINEWLSEQEYPQKNQLKHSDVELLESFGEYLGINIRPNWYRQFNWKESDDLPYFWPSKELTDFKKRAL